MPSTWKLFCLSVGLLLAFDSCHEKRALKRLELLPPSRTGVTFENKIQENAELNIITFEYLYNGAGVGVGDFNNDGLSDLFFAANMSPNKLYLNRGDFRFEDISESSGLTAHQNANPGKWATGVSVIDINQDGWQDFYVCYAGPFAAANQRANELYINNHDNTFTEKARDYGLADTGHSVQAAFLDYDKDGDLDMYLLTNITDETGPNIIRPKRLNGQMANTDRLYRNKGDNTFTNVSREAGILAEGYGLGVSICDFNDDNWSDIYVSNDYLSNDLLYINNKDGTFTDQASKIFDHTSYSAMGNDVSDFNNDGLPDIVAVDMLPPDNKRQKLMFGATNYDRYRSEARMGYTPQFMRNTLQLGMGTDGGHPVFSEIGQLAGIAATDWSWSPLFADIDNDGLRDLLITNGYPRDITNRDFASYRASEFIQQGFSQKVDGKLMDEVNKLEGAYLPHFAFHNNGDLSFSDSSSAWGFIQASYGTGAAYADLDNDGDLDYITNNTNEPAFIYKNNSREMSGNHYLRIDLVGPKGNRNGFGAKLSVTYGGHKAFVEHSTCRGFQSTVESKIHFGLGRDSIVTSVKVRWPDGKTETLVNVKGDQTLKINYSNAVEAVDSLKAKQDPVFAKRAGFDGFRHQETHYADFKVQPLIPHKYSQQGPALAVADVDNDGRDDFFVGGAFNQSGEIHRQTNGDFKSEKLGLSKKFEEDIGALFFDGDRDGDEDLYVVSGGNEFGAGSEFYQDRYYVNNGNGIFKQDIKALPVEHASGSCVVGADYDGDGDIDLFVGGRLNPESYPDAGESFILRNDGGQFQDVTEQIAPGLKNAGMVSAALWTDFNNDNYPDLLVVGEWMPVSLYENVRGKLINVTEKFGLGKSAGWWNSVSGADVDQDGDIDYILGNLGMNSRYAVDKGASLHAYAGDFNDDGKREAILTQRLQGKEYPAHPRDDLFLRLPSFKKFYTTYAAYAAESIEGLLTRSPKTKIDTLTAFVSTSSILINNGNAPWTLRPLPVEAQFAPVYGSMIKDFTNDDLDDILLVGNSDAPDVLTGRYDALKGLLLVGDGAGQFKSMSLDKSGLNLPGDCKSLVSLNIKGQASILVGMNNASVAALTYNVKGTYHPAQKNETHCMISFINGKSRRIEFYRGSGYLSQSPRGVTITSNSGNLASITFYNHRGPTRTIK